MRLCSLSNATLAASLAALCASPLIAEEPDDAAPPATPPAAEAPDDIASSAQRITALRLKISAAEDALRASREAARTRVASLTAETEGLRSQVTHAEARDRSLKQLLEQRNNEVAERTDHSRRLRAPLLDALDVIARSVALSSPLHRPQRLSRIATLREEVAADRIPPHEATEALWKIVEDELELARTTQITRHIVPVGEAKRLIPVVALGTVAIFWITRDGDGGRVAWRDGQWTTTRIQDPDALAAIRALIQAEQANTATPTLMLPMPPPIVEDDAP